MGRLRVLSGEEVCRILEQNGFVAIRQRGSHRQMRHPTKPGTVTVAGPLSQDIRPKTERSILRQAQLLEDDNEEAE